MPEEVSLEEAEVGGGLSRGRALSMEMLEVELQQKVELKMAAETDSNLKIRGIGCTVQGTRLVRDQKRALEELEMENELMQRKFWHREGAMRKSRQNLKLTNGSAGRYFARSAGGGKSHCGPA